MELPVGRSKGCLVLSYSRSIEDRVDVGAFRSQ